MFKQYSIPLDEADKIIRDKMLFFRKLEEEKRLKEEERIRKEATKIAKKENISVEEVIAGADIKEIPKTIGTTTIKKIWTFEIIDEKKIPRDFLMIDEVNIREAIRKGVREISGIKIFEKETISTR